MHATDPAARGPRILVPVLIVALSLALAFVPGWIAPMTLFHFMSMGFAPLLGSIGLLVWWTFARRVTWRDRLLGAAAGIAVIAIVLFVVHPSIVQLLVVRGLPLSLGLTGVALLLTRSMSWSRRRWLFAACFALGLLPWAAFRADGQRGSLEFEISPRWQETAEERFLERRGAATPTAADRGAAGSLAGAEASWPGFRGPARDGAAPGVRFATDWEAHPPRERWRHAVGPGWSSFAVASDLAFTQEQRGEDEVVVAYALGDGREVWVHASAERFEEPQGGPGPRATPAYDDGSIFALGASGTLTCLDAAQGERRWSRNLRDDLSAPLPPWGFSGSPLVLGRAVIVFAGAGDDRGLAAYDRDSGERLWTAGKGQLSFSSPMPVTIDGTAQALIATDFGVEAFRPEDGAPLWSHEWRTPQMARIAMPLVLGDGRTVMLPTGVGMGTRRLEVHAASDGGFAAEPGWESQALKPYFNDAVCHEGHCYGFDNRIFTCIDAEDGARRWKGGRYGNGQVLLLPDMDTLLVITEEGEIVLLATDPSALREIARLQALGGKTWNHPVVVRGLLLLRNDEEAVVYELPGA